MKLSKELEDRFNEEKKKTEKAGNLSSEWEQNIFNKTKYVEFLFFLNDFFIQMKNTINVADVMIKMRTPRQRAWTMLDDFWALGIIKKEKVGKKEAHFHPLIEKGKIMHQEALEKYFEYADKSGIQKI